MRDMERNSLTCMRELLLLAQERENSARERIPFTSKKMETVSVTSVLSLSDG